MAERRPSGALEKGFLLGRRWEGENHSARGRCVAEVPAVWRPSYSGLTTWRAAGERLEVGFEGEGGEQKENNSDGCLRRTRQHTAWDKNMPSR
jgi:hypothetical protein